jgi:hypothetical protein
MFNAAILALYRAALKGLMGWVRAALDRRLNHLDDAWSNFRTTSDLEVNCATPVTINGRCASQLEEQKTWTFSTLVSPIFSHQPHLWYSNICGCGQLVGGAGGEGLPGEG